MILFKVNTEYKLLISDWSSDVCSSDLQWPGDRRYPPGRAGPTDTDLRHCRDWADAGHNRPAQRVRDRSGARHAADRRDTGSRTCVASSEERRVGTESVSPCKSRWSTYLYIKKNRERHNTTNNKR